MYEIPRDLAQMALDSQSACNLSGLVHSLSTICNQLWDEARKTGQGTDYVNTHPVVKLFVYQLTFLSTGKESGMTTEEWQAAYRACEEALK